jgi:hypothetical protein
LVDRVRGRGTTRRQLAKRVGLAAIGLAASRMWAQVLGGRGVYASALGCALDGKTDDTEKLNAVLATATAERPVHLVLDGMAAVRGLVLAAGGHTTVEGIGWDSGIVILPGSNGDGVRIGPLQGDGEGSGKAGPMTASRITLRNMQINGNRGANLTKTQDGGGTTPEGRGVYGVLLTNVREVLVEYVTFVNAPLYSLCLGNCAGVQVRGCRFVCKRDGIHVDGPASDLIMEDCHFETNDDAIALNAPEGHTGDINDVRISRCYVQNAWTLLRIYTSLKGIPGNTHRVRRVVVSDCTGATDSPCFNLGIESDGASAAPGQVEDVLISGCELSCNDGFAVVRTPFESLTFRDCTWHAPALTRGIGIRVYGQVTELVLDNFTVLRNEEGHEVVVPIEISSPVEELVLQGVRVVDLEGANYAPLPFWLNLLAMVMRLRIESLSMTHVRAILNPAMMEWGRVADGGVCGAGVLGTGMPIPDRAVGDGVMYLSAESGRVSVKEAGVVRSVALKQQG